MLGSTKSFCMQTYYVGSSLKMVCVIKIKKKKTSLKKILSDCPLSLFPHLRFFAGSLEDLQSKSRNAILNLSEVTQSTDTQTVS